MNLSLIRSMTRSAVFELENGKCFRPEHPFAVALNGKTIYESCNTNVFSLFSLTPSTAYTVEVDAEGEHLKLDFTTEAESFFVDASRYGLVADGETDNTGRLQAALSTCPRGGTVYVPAGRYRTASLFMKSCTTLYLEKGAVLLGDNDRTHYPILPGVIPSENEVDEYYLTGWEGNPLNSFAGLLNITQVHDVVVTGEGTLDCDAQNGDWWVDPKVKRIAWRPRAVAMVDSENICLHGITVQNSYSWTIHPIFVKHLDLLNFNINNPYNAPNTDGIDPESCEYTPKLGTLTMEDIVATDAQFAGCYFDGLPEQPIEGVSMKNVTITFDPNAKEGQAAMADNRPLVKKLAIYAENVKNIELHNVRIEGYEGERLRFANVGHFEED